MRTLEGAVESCYAEVLGVVALGVAASAHASGSLDVDAKKLELLLPSAIEIAGVILGFAMAAEAIVLGLSGPLIKRFAEADGFKSLLWFMTSLTLSAVVLLIGSLVVLMLYPGNSAGSQVSPLVVGLLAGVSVWMVASVWRVIRTLQAVVRMRFDQKE